MNLKKAYQLFLFVLLSNLSIAQYDFYIEVTPNADEIEFLESLEKLSEKNMDSIRIYENGFVPLTRKEAKENLQIKQKNKHLKLPTYRIYFNPSHSFDTLTILGISRNYADKVFTENNKDSTSQLWVVPLFVYKNLISEKEYNKLSELLLKLFNLYYKNYDSTTKFNSVNFTINEKLNILSSSLYLFTCGEVKLYEDPYNPASEITGKWSPHNFIRGNSYTFYENFPLPDRIHFSLLIKLEQDSSLSNFNHKKYIDKLTSDLKIIFECDNIGVTYSRESNVKTFWANKNYVINYLTGYSEFQTGMYFLQMSSFYNSFKR